MEVTGVMTLPAKNLKMDQTIIDESFKSNVEQVYEGTNKMSEVDLQIKELRSQLQELENQYENMKSKPKFESERKFIIGKIDRLRKQKNAINIRNDLLMKEFGVSYDDIKKWSKDISKYSKIINSMDPVTDGQKKAYEINNKRNLAGLALKESKNYKKIFGHLLSVVSIWTSNLWVKAVGTVSNFKGIINLKKTQAGRNADFILKHTDYIEEAKPIARRSEALSQSILEVCSELTEDFSQMDENQFNKEIIPKIQSKYQEKLALILKIEEKENEIREKEEKTKNKTSPFSDFPNEKE